MKIGLEVHVQLKTRTKLFCGCLIKSDAEPNTHTCDTCMGLPGSKPRLNKAAVEAGIKIALAFGCRLPAWMRFSRKTYLYPDMPKNYQITQYEMPLAENGKLEIIGENGKPKWISISRVNIEEDPGRLVHVGGSITTSNYVLVDYNRAGVSLAEIVTAPDISSAREARNFLQRLESIMEYLGVYKPGELALRADANISLEGGERVEIKNITGFRDVEKALVYEQIRQKDILRKGEKIERETRGWDSKTGVTHALRKKEFEEDYGYIFEPDLRRIDLVSIWIKKVRTKLPELPHEKIARYRTKFKISRELAFSIAGDIRLAQFYENVAKKIEPRLAATWVDILKKTLYYNDLSIGETKMTPELLIRLVRIFKAGKLTDLGTERVLREIVMKPKRFNKLIKKYGRIKTLQGGRFVKIVLRKEKKAISAYQAGDKKVMKYLIGQLIRESGHTIDAKTAKKLLEKALK